jgi:1-acyl-sn-glycerol-3-phosphate acyltransferase
MNLFALIRSTLAVFLFFPIVTLLLCVATLFAVFVLRSEKISNKLILLWGRFSCFVFNVDIEVQGRESRPTGGAIILFNHKSFFDIFALYSQFPEARFGAKIELFSIPLFGATMKALGTLPIARGNREAAIRVLQDSYEAARKGRQFALSPEGGRNTGAGILPFKAGPFLVAIEAGVPIMPLVICGADEVWPKATLIPATKFWRSKITMKVLEPISTVGFTTQRRDELQKIVRERMITALSELSNP